MSERVLATAMPGSRDLTLLAVGVIAVGTSGPLIAATALAIPILIFWRNFVGAVVSAPLALKEYFSAQVRPNKSPLLLSMLSGILLAVHFIFFFTAMRWTTVAAGTALAALQPVFAALFALAQKHHVPRRAWWGMLIAFMGVLVIGGVDYTISTRAILGDLAGILAAVLGAAYVSVVAHSRRSLSTSQQTTICYFTCAAVMAIVMVILKLPFTGFGQRDWLIILGLIVGAQLLGHSVFNFVLKTTSATVVSMIVLFETPVAAIIAAMWLRQAPPLAIYPAIALLMIGSALVVAREETA